MTTNMLVRGAAIAMAMAGTIAVTAQQTGFTRTPVQQGDLSIPGREVVQAIATIQPAAESGFHTHPGDEAGYVLEGTFILEMRGKPSVTKKAGEGFIIPFGTVHNVRNTGAVVAKVLATYIIEKGKPVATPVP